MTTPNEPRDPKALASDVQEAVAALNVAILDAYSAGLVVKATIEENAGPREARWPIIHIDILMQL